MINRTTLIQRLEPPALWDAMPGEDKLTQTRAMRRFDSVRSEPALRSSRAARAQIEGRTMTMDTMTTDPSSCRLCGGVAAFSFMATVLSKYRIAYFKCIDCDSLQTEPPYWLDEAYDGHLGHLDLGVVQRNLTNQAACYLVAKLWGLRNTLDYGGGDGLLCRMIRDHGVNCYVWDKYGSPVYAQTFTAPDFSTPDLIVSFEVFEHFSRPNDDLVEIFGRGSSLILASTGLYRGQGADWFYLSLPSGRHVFFYSPKAIHLIAERFGYRAFISGPYLLFVKPDAAKALPVAIFKLMTKTVPLRLLRAAMAVKPAPGVAKDAALMRRVGEAKPVIGVVERG